MDNQQDKAAKLAQGIANARKVMEKVEINTGGKPMGGGRQTMNYEEREPEYLTEQEMIARTRSAGNINPQTSMKNLQTSKMPKEILESFINNPIVDPTAPIGLDSVVEQVAKVQPKVKQIQEINENRQPAQAAVTLDKELIEYIIKKTVETVLEEQSKKTSIDENFQIKIGEKVFGGKLSVLKENNKTTKK
jgi:hypothetical protein